MQRKIRLVSQEAPWYSPGAKCKEFEERFAALHGAKHGLFVNSGTDALRIALLALKEKYRWQDGDEVAVPALTFPATINVVLQANLKPRLVDVSMHDYTMNAWNLERQWDTAPDKLAGLKCVIPVHLFGQSCDGKIYEMASHQGWKVLEDSCETILNPLKGDISCFSTYMAHHVMTGVGGMAITDDEDLSYLMWSYANHGRKEAGKFEFERIGYSCRATEMQAELGLAQLDGLEKQIAERRAVAYELRKALETFEELTLADGNWRGQNHTWLMFPIVVKEISEIERDRLCAELGAAGIETRPMMPVTNQSCYKDLVAGQVYSVADRVNRQGFYIPCRPDMTGDDVMYIADVFAKVLDKSANVV